MAHSIPYLNATTVASLIGAMERTGGESEFPMDGDSRLRAERRYRIQAAQYNRARLKLHIESLGARLADQGRVA